MADVEIVEVQVYEYSESLKKAWWLLLVDGVLSVGIAVLLIFWPGATITVVTAIVGFFMIATGVIRFFVAIFDSHAPDRWLMAFAGIFGIVLGVVVMKNPEGTIKIIALIVAIFWLISGLVDLFRGLGDSELPDRTLRIVFGVVSVAFGVVILVWPTVTIGVFVILTGIFLLLFGALEILASFRLKNA